MKKQMLLACAALIGASCVSLHAMDSEQISPAQLLEAARDGKAEIVDAYIKTGKSVNVVTGNGFTPIFLAAHNGNKSIVEKLLKAKANPNALRELHPIFAHQSIPTSRSPIVAAIEREHWDVIELLLLNGADTREFTFSGSTLLLHAAEEGLCKLVEIQIAKGESINKREKPSNITPLRQAAQNGHEEVVKLLIAHEAEIDTFDAIGYTPLTTAAENGHFNIVKLLIAHNAQVNAQDKNSDKKLTPLIQASQNGHTVIVAHLIDHGADANLCSVFGPALYFAAQNNHTKVAEILLKAKARFDIKCPETGWTPLLVAASRGHIGIIKLLFAYGAKNFEQLHIALIIAAGNNQSETCSYLIRQGANIFITFGAPNIKEKQILDFAKTPETRDAMLTEFNKWTS